MNPRSVVTAGTKHAPPHVTGPATRRRTFAGAALIVVATALAYSRVPWNGFVWDDDGHITKNAPIWEPGGLARIWFEPGATPQYYPLVFSSFWLEYRLWGFNPAGYHITNVLLHAINAVLVWRLLRRLGVPAAFFAGLVFAVHPVHVESVAWVTERKNTLSGLLYLLATCAYLRFRPLDPAKDANKPQTAAPAPRDRWGAYALALLAFAAALSSKTIVCTLPAALLVVIWWRRGRVVWRDMWPLIPFFALAGAFAAGTASVEHHEAGAYGPEWAFTPLQRLLIAGQALWFYAWKLVWPAQLAFTYPRWEIEAEPAWSYVFPAAALAALVTLWLLRRRLGRGPLTAALLFAGTLVPALGFVNFFYMLYSFVADHLQYHASIGLIALLAASGAAVLERLGPDGRRLRTPLAAACVMLLALLTWNRTQVFHDPITLWTDTLRKNPTSWMVNGNFANSLDDAGRTNEAIACHEAALRARPDHADSLSNLAVIYARQRRFAEAEPLFRRALATRFLVRETRLAGVRRNLAVCLVALQRWDEAGETIAPLVHDAPEVFNQLIEQPAPAMIELAAAGYAHAGEFRRAAETAQRALNMLRAEPPQVRERVQAARDAYAAGRLFQYATAGGMIPASAASATSAPAGH